MSYNIGETIRLRLKEGIDGTLVEGYYTIGGILTIQELLNFGVSAYSDIYSTYGYTQDEYDILPRTDVVYALTSTDSEVLNVPSEVLEEVTENPLVPYRSMVLAISLGEHPEYREFTLLKQYLENAVVEYIGINPDINIINTSNPIQVPEDRHLYLQALRDRISATIKTPSRRLIQRETELEFLQQENLGLRTFIQEYLADCAVDCGGDPIVPDPDPTSNTRIDVEAFNFSLRPDNLIWNPCGSNII